MIPRLISICEKQLASLLTLKNVGEILQLSSDFNAAQLKDCCMDFVCYNFGALLESKLLDVVDSEVLQDVSKHYQKLNKVLSSRIITPYDHGPSTDDLEIHAASTDLSIEELFEYETEFQQKEIQELNISSSSNKPKRTRKISTESTGSSGSETDLNTSKEVDIEDEALLDDFENLDMDERHQNGQHTGWNTKLCRLGFSLITMLCFKVFT